MCWPVLGSNESASPFSAETMLRDQACPHCGCCAACAEKHQAEKPATASHEGRTRRGLENFIRIRLEGILFRRLGGAQLLQKRFPSSLQPFFQPPGAVTITTGPGFSAVPIATVLPVVRVLYAKQLEILLPIGPFLLERRGAKTSLDPVRGAVLGDARLFQIVDILVARDGTAAQSFFLDGLAKRVVMARF